MVSNELISDISNDVSLPELTYINDHIRAIIKLFVELSEKNGRIFRISMEEIGSLLGVSRKTAQRWMKEVVEANNGSLLHKHRNQWLVFQEQDGEKIVYQRNDYEVSERAILLYKLGIKSFKNKRKPYSPRRSKPPKETSVTTELSLQFGKEVSENIICPPSSGTNPKDLSFSSSNYIYKENIKQNNKLTRYSAEEVARVEKQENAEMKALDRNTANGQSNIKGGKGNSSSPLFNVPTVQSTLAKRVSSHFSKINSDDLKRLQGEITSLPTANLYSGKKYDIFTYDPPVESDREKQEIDTALGKLKETLASISQRSPLRGKYYTQRVLHEANGRDRYDPRILLLLLSEIEGSQKRDINGYINHRLPLLGEEWATKRRNEMQGQRERVAYEQRRKAEEERFDRESHESMKISFEEETGLPYTEENFQKTGGFRGMLERKEKKFKKERAEREQAAKRAA